MASRRGQEQRRLLLDYRGYGGFIPFTELEKAARRSHRLEVLLDQGAPSRLVAMWASSRGLHARVEAGAGWDRVVIERGVPSEAQPEAVEEREVERVSEVRLVVSAAYDDEASARLANLPEVVRLVIRSPILYRGVVSDPRFTSILSREMREGKLLLRITAAGVDYLFLIEKGEVRAAAKVGTPLSRRDAENLLKKLVGEKEAVVTLYRIREE